MNDSKFYPVKFLKDAPGFLLGEVWPVFWPVMIPVMLAWLVFLFLTTPIKQWNG